MKYVPITAIMHDTQCIVFKDWTGQLIADGLVDTTNHLMR